MQYASINVLYMYDNGEYVMSNQLVENGDGGDGCIVDTTPPPPLHAADLRNECLS